MQASMLKAPQYGNMNFFNPSPSGPSENDETTPIFESTPVAARLMSASKNTKPLSSLSIKGPLKIDSNFFAGLSSSNSPEKRTEQVEGLPTSPTSPGGTRQYSSTSYAEDIHFEPLIPLPKQIEVQTGEEDEEVMFSSRAKLYRYDKEVLAWKERGIGTLKILHNAERGRSRILMRREVLHKICANHFITDNMKLKEKKDTANAWLWNTFADFSEEISKPEQLAVRFKTQDDFLLFKKKFEQAQKMSKKVDSKVQESTVSGTSKKSFDSLAKLAPKPGSWSCSVCFISNEECTTVCIACGTAKLSDESKNTLKVPKSDFRLLRESTTSSKPNTTLGGLQENASSGSPFTFGKNDSETASITPFPFGKSNTGTVNSSSFVFES